MGGFEEAFHGIYALYEDQAFLAKVYLNARVLVSGERWLRYRQHANSCVSVVNSGGHYKTVRRFFLEWLSDYVQAHDVRDVRVRLALRRALRSVRQPTVSRLQTHGRTFVGRVLRLGIHIAHVRIAPLLSRLLTLSRPGNPPRVGHVRFGDLRRLQPVSREFGYDRGLPIDGTTSNGSWPPGPTTFMGA